MRYAICFLIGVAVGGILAAYGDFIHRLAIQ